MNDTQKLEIIKKTVERNLKINRNILDEGDLKVIEKFELEGQIMALEILEHLFWKWETEDLK